MIDLKKTIKSLKIDEKDVKFLLNLLFFVIINGLILNYVFYQLTNMKFTWSSFAAYGFAAWIIENKIPFLIRKLRNNN